MAVCGSDTNVKTGFVYVKHVKYDRKTLLEINKQTRTHVLKSSLQTNKQKSIKNLLHKITFFYNL